MSTTAINASKFLALAKQLYKTGSGVDARSQYLDVSVTPNVTRDYQNTQEVLDYLSNSNATIQAALRGGGFTVLVNSGGTYANGVITGGSRLEYWFKDGVADNNLVLKTVALPALAAVATSGSYTDLSGKPDLTNYQLVPDGLISSGGVTGSTSNYNITIAGPVKWRVNGQNFEVGTSQTFTLADAVAGEFRKDIIAGDNQGHISVIQGTSSATTAVPPAAPANSVVLATIDVDGAGTGTVQQSSPVDLSAYETFSYDNTEVIADFDNFLNFQGAFLPTTLNSPYTNEWGYALSKSGNNWHHQWAWSNNPDQGYCKRSNINGGGWSPWQRYPTTAEVITVPLAQQQALPAGISFFLSLFKDPQTQAITLDTTVQSVDIFAPSSTVGSLLFAASGWGNISGQSSEYKQLTGNNANGQIGRGGQLLVYGRCLYICLSHVLGTNNNDGSANWARCRLIPFLDPNDAINDGPLITQLQTESNWNGDEYFIGTQYPSTPGDSYSGVNGYTYTCISQYGWRRLGATPPGQPMQITANDHPNLCTSLTTHNYANGDYIQGTNSNDEVSYQGQEYWFQGYIFRKGLAGAWACIAKSVNNFSA